MRGIRFFIALQLLLLLSAGVCQGKEKIMIDKAFFNHRVHPGRYMDERKLEEFFAAVKRNNHHGDLPTIVFFTQNSHSSMRLELLRPRAEKIAAAVRRAHELGMSAGINVLCTLGHLKEQLDMTPGESMRYMIDMEGRPSLGCYCPNDPRTHEYIRQVYELFAACKPDEIWVDDDLRLYGHTVAECCFCPECIARFNRENGTAYTRETLCKTFHQGSVPEKIAIRSLWTAHNGKVLTGIVELIEKTVHRVSPETRIGIMTGMRGYDNNDFAAYARAAAGKERLPVLWRPGGGMYHDRYPTAILGKATVIGIQCAFLPPEVQIIQSELECFPYQTMRKSRHMINMEIFCYIASGCTGSALNVTGEDEPISVYEPWMAELDAQRPFFDLMVRSCGGKAPVGLGACWNRKSFAAAMLNGNWPRGNANEELYLGHTELFFESGLPIGFDSRTAPVKMLTGDQVHTFSDAELAELLAGAV